MTKSRNANEITEYLLQWKYKKTFHFLNRINFSRISDETSNFPSFPEVVFSIQGIPLILQTPKLVQQSIAKKLILDCLF